MGATFGWCFTLWSLFILSLDLFSMNVCAGLTKIYEKECQGTANKFSTTGKDHKQRYEEYKRLYENCTFIRRNIEISTFELSGSQYDFSFLDTIREVNGYVLIFRNHVRKIRLDGLRVIRGEKPFSLLVNNTERNISLFVGWNDKSNDDSIGLKELQLTSLVEITNGGVYFAGNSKLCYGETTIDWKYIMHNNPKGEILIDSSGKKVACSGTCQNNCTIGKGKYCWANKSSWCQAERPCKDCRRGCSDCSCYSECIGGCIGSDPSSCVACKHLLRVDECVENCSSPRYNRDTKQWEDPPITYMWNRKCVAKCPENMLMQGRACVTACHKGYVENKTSGECIKCHKECPTTCGGTGSSWLHGNNLAQFNQCMIVDGHLKILDFSFNGDDIEGPAIKFDDLKTLKNIQEITGRLTVDAKYTELTSLSFLKNLRTIGGYEAGSYSMFISSTALKALNLTRMNRIKTGGVYITENTDLCYVYTINWTRILTSKEEKQIHLTANANLSTCEAKGLTCSSRCSNLGCWGPGDDNCLS